MKVKSSGFVFNHKILCFDKEVLQTEESLVILLIT